MNKQVILLLKISIAFSLLYPAISGLINPTNWIGFLPNFIFNISLLSASTTLIIIEIIEILVAIWLLVYKNPKYPAIFSTLILSGIIIFNLNSFEIIFRDISLLLISIALVIYGHNLKVNKKENV